MRNIKGSELRKHILNKLKAHVADIKYRYGAENLKDEFDSDDFYWDVVKTLREYPEIDLNTLHLKDISDSAIATGQTDEFLVDVIVRNLQDKLIPVLMDTKPDGINLREGQFVITFLSFEEK